MRMQLVSPSSERGELGRTPNVPVGSVRPNPPPLSVLVRVMVLRITCIVCNVEMLSSHPKVFTSF